MTPVAAAVSLGVTPFAIDEAGFPHLLRGGLGSPRMPAADAATAARMQVARLAPVWGVNDATLPALESLGEVAMPAGTIVRLRQVIDGLQVDRDSGGEIHVMVGSGGELVAASGRLIPSDTQRARDVAYTIDEPGAVARAVSDFYNISPVPAALSTRSMASDGSRMLAGQIDDVVVSRSRARRAWVAQGGALTRGWLVEVYASNATSSDGDAFRTVLSGDGQVLSRQSLKEDVAYTYRVFADSTGELKPFDGPLVDVAPHAVGSPNTVPYPPYVLPSLVTIEGLNHNLSGAPDAWLKTGRTETIGNNVEAYTDIHPPDGLTSGDFRATLTSSLAFDRTFDTSVSATATQAQQMAGITQLFYSINWLHDFWYDAGFTEATGNAQDGNFNRGGEDGDAMLAEAQDNASGGSRNNANMTTPADGFPPRMQVFVWDGRDDRSLGLSGRKPVTGPASFGNRNFDFTAPVVLADDGSSTTSDACTPLSAPATGKIVLVDGGRCTFKLKALNVQNAGGIAMLLADSVTAGAPPSMGDDANITTPITIGCLSVLRTEGDAIKADLSAGPVTAQIQRAAAGDLEGTLDFTVVAHEFGHYLHHRLQSCNTALCGAMSEGWADFDSLLTMVKSGDDFDGAFPIGTYSAQGFTADPVYFGLRRAPYSASLEINPLTFKHMGIDDALPTGTPAHPFNGSGNPSEVHNAGEVWASMLWQGYSALLKQPGADFAATRRRMQQYVVSGLLLSPVDGTPTEARDAILAAAHAASPAEHDVLAAAYAQRGFGSCAVSSARTSRPFTGIVESYEVKGRLAAGAPTIQMLARCDGDDVLDGGETARITIPVANSGPAALTDVNIRLAATPGVHVEQPSVSVGSLAAYATIPVSFNVALDDSVSTRLVGDFSVDMSSSNGCATTLNMPLSMRLNSDDLPESSATETFDTGTSVWTQQGTAKLWSHNRGSGLDGFWAAADVGTSSDASLISPSLTAGPGPVSISFSHRFSFEAIGATAFDGGVIEISTSNGATWADISTVANPDYNSMLTGGPDTTGNPLAGRRAYGRSNLAFPNPETVELQLGTAFAGKTFRIRFRAGSDNVNGARGWEIDNVAFTGIVGMPFPTLVPDAGHCAVGQAPGQPGGNGNDPGGSGDGDGDSDAGGCQTGGGGAGTCLVLGIAAVLLRRRRC
jgi:large repetitive protein